MKRRTFVGAVAASAAAAVSRFTPSAHTARYPHVPPNEPDPYVPPSRP